MTLLPCLSIRQPWTFSIFHLGKPIENRTWPTKYRGPLTIHVSAHRPTALEIEEFICVAEGAVGHNAFYAELKRATPMAIGVARWGHLPRGGIIGTVDLVDCVTESDSPWFFGPYGFVIANPRPCKFVPMKGRLGLFNIDANLIERVA